jgi:hypothetical protein
MHILPNTKKAKQLKDCDAKLQGLRDLILGQPVAG